MDIFIAVLGALLVRDVLRFIAVRLDWKWSVNRGYSFWSPPPWHVQFVRAIAGRTELR